MALEKLGKFNMFAQNIDCGYTVESTRQGGSNEYQIYVLEQKLRKLGRPLQTLMFLYKSRVKGCSHFTDMYF